MRREISVHGKPVPQGSLRPMVNKHTGKPFTPQSNKVLTFRNDIRAEWGDPQPVTTPVSVFIIFRFPHPKSHYFPQTKARAAYEVLRPEWVDEWFMAKMPDVDKLCRAVLDALTDYAVHDDRQVVELVARKVWAEPDDRVGRTDITIQVAEGS